MSEQRLQDDIVRWIRQNHESLSPSQQKVAEFLLKGGIDVIHLTITEIADAVGVNSSTVVRTAQALGFEGFPELQSVLRSQFLNQAKIAQRMQIGSQKLLEDLSTGDHENAHLFNTVLRDGVQNLLDLPQHVPVRIFDRAIDMIDQAGHVYIIGLGTSFPLALNFGNVLRYIRPDTTVLTPGIDPIPAQLTPLKEDDLIFSLCFARYTRETLTVMEVGKERGASVLTVTDSHVSPAATRSDLALIVPFRLRLYSNSVALFALLDAILGALSLRYPEKTRERLERLEELYQQFNLLTLDDD
ncbi:MAG: MurR/RpiR family transcriptional regulator [Chloroflexota bacterium]|nr:MurR/RpiR family transcriptional regulator [Chloroflexota bacterium]